MLGGKLLTNDKYKKTTNSVDSYVNEIIRSKDNRFQNIRKQKLGLPNFNDNVRNYICFIKDFKSLGLPAIAPEQSAFSC